MITPELIARINALAKKSREAGLTDNERSEQAELRRRYLDNIRTQVKAQLDCIEIVDHEENCKCGCHNQH
ncbi:hypothetical protein SOV_23250 [Sporomusa ovata DSM 2662]|uniref:UPF0291 protein SpAn4DRAFT_0660 n=1 Tax=Sporomusa ovata TaxID=2378 RepID=A0A0U1L3E6_9FIRM|nr:DUF896 domain-containing protein [Sporomusa ovata]EQB25641.1 hypothetical protein SOV_4c03040 [Sporomusa ovata DSM 2662]CQR74198.1 hypothetical protein SpAn4DRAFT_0660 [Sporomusa ovata]